jgi:4-hydroxybenzoate polyprenyltransferase
MLKSHENPSKPVAVDLDGTLVKTDLLLESINAYLAQNPLRLLKLISWVLGGRLLLKARLAEKTDLDFTSLPYNTQVLKWLHEQRAAGRTLVLATASHRVLAEGVSQHLGIFDAVLATDGDTNLKARKKSNSLVASYGLRGFDYVGNEGADLDVWSTADKAHVVSSSRALVARVRSQGNLGEIFDPEHGNIIHSLFRAVRLHQWMKNLLIFVPLVTSHSWTNLTADWRAIVAFVVFGLTASSIYVVNDMIDVTDDRHHRRKRERPFAAGHLSLAAGWVLWPALLGVAVTITLLLLPPAFLLALLGYVVLTLVYSLFLKQRAVVDVLALATLFTLRIIAGATAISVPVSFWLLTFSMFFFLSLAFIKRFSELQTARDADYRGQIRGRGYFHTDLEMISSLGAGSGLISVLVLALYVQDRHTAELYKTPEFLWLACPLVLFWISRAWLLTHRGLMHDDPIVFALKDRMSWIVVAVLVLALALGVVVG